MAWEHCARYSFLGRSWTLWVDHWAPGGETWWFMLPDREGVSVEPSGIGHKSRREATRGYAEDIGSEIRRIRLNLGLSQEDFAQKLKVRAITVSRWERGEQLPSQAALSRIEQLVEKRR